MGHRRSTAGPGICGQSRAPGDCRWAWAWAVVWETQEQIKPRMQSSCTLPVHSHLQGPSKQLGVPGPGSAFPSTSKCTAPSVGDRREDAQMLQGLHFGVGGTSDSIGSARWQSTGEATAGASLGACLPAEPPSLGPRSPVSPPSLEHSFAHSVRSTLSIAAEFKKNGTCGGLQTSTDMFITAVASSSDYEAPCCRGGGGG